MKNTKGFERIGTATIDLSKFKIFRESERQKRKNGERCWPAVMWKEYFYSHQDVYKYAEVGYFDCNCLNHTPLESFDKQVEETCHYLEIMGLSWELLFTNEFISIIRFGTFAFGLPTDQNIIACYPYANFDNYTMDELRSRIGGGDDGNLTALVPNGSLSRMEVKSRIATTQQQIDEQRAELIALEEQQREEIDRIKNEIEAKYRKQFDLIEQKKREMEEMVQSMENQLFVLDTELYAIRCWMGETIKFSKLCSGKYAGMEVPVVLYQKLRYLDEEMGKYLSIYDFDADDQSSFEEAIRHRQDLRDIFAPPEKSISLICVSRNRIQYGCNPTVANMLKAYETYHGNQIGILLRDGENVWIGWTDIDKK